MPMLIAGLILYYVLLYFVIAPVIRSRDLSKGQEIFGETDQGQPPDQLREIVPETKISITPKTNPKTEFPKIENEIPAKEQAGPLLANPPTDEIKSVFEGKATEDIEKDMLGLAGELELDLDSKVVYEATIEKEDLIYKVNGLSDFKILDEASIFQLVEHCSTVKG